jgi:hypothetical protein
MMSFTYDVSKATSRILFWAIRVSYSSIEGSSNDADIQEQDRLSIN